MSSENLEPPTKLVANESKDASEPQNDRQNTESPEINEDEQPPAVDKSQVKKYK